MQAASIVTARDARQRTIHLVLFSLVVAYAALLLSTFFMGIWLIDRQGQPVATDFVTFWAAGKLVMQGHAADAYDWALHKAAALRSGAVFSGHFTFQYPPTFLMVTPLAALLTYPAALVAWMGLGLALYLLAVRLVRGSWNAAVAALAWPAVLWNVVVGQNGFLLAALLGAGAALVEKRPALAGICFGLLTFKPQFGLLIPVALLAGGHWRVIAWAALTAGVMTAVSLLLLGPDVWSAFLQSAGRINTAILADGGTNFSELQSLYGYLRALGASASVAWAAHGLLVALLAAILIWLWRGKAAFDVRAAALVAATMLASPYSFIYDFVALAIPLVFLGRSGFSGREMAAIVLAGALVGWGPAEHVATALFAGLIIMGLVLSRAFTLRGRIL